MASHDILAKTPTDLELRIERQIRLRTQGKIRQLHIAEREGKVTVWGYVSTFYTKQLAIQAVKDILGEKPFEMAIEVIDDADRLVVVR